MPYGAGRCFLLADRMALVKQASLGVGLMRKRDQSPPTCVESLIDVVWSRGGAAIVSDGFTSETKSASNCACSFWPWCSETGHVLLSANAEAQRESGNIFSKTHRAQNDTLHFSVQVKSSPPSTINHCHFSFSGTHRHNALSGHIIRYPLKVLWPPFCLSRRLTFSVAQKSTRCQQRSCENLVHINLILLGSFCSFCWPQIYGAPHWIDIWWVWRPPEYSTLTAVSQKQLGDWVSPLTWLIFLQEAPV